MKTFEIFCFIITTYLNNYSILGLNQVLFEGENANKLGLCLIMIGFYMFTLNLNLS